MEGELGMKISLSKPAKKFMQEKQINDVTFSLLESDVVGCCVGFVKEIVSKYEAPKNAASYRYVQADGYHIFISRKIRILGPLTVTTEGAWKMKRLALDGATVPL
jgi:hypothetical protein